MSEVVCPFHNTEHNNSELEWVNRRWLSRNNLSGGAEGLLENWDGENLRVDTYNCSACEGNIPSEIKTFGYSKEFGAYVYIFKDGRWRNMNAPVIDKNRANAVNNE
jgi:hypothetical protein